MWALRAIFVVLAVIAVVAFAYHNLGTDQTVTINLIWAVYADVPLITVVFWSFVAGVLVSLFVFVSMFIRQSMLLRSGRKRVKALESEVAVLRNRPIEESADLLKGADTRAAERGRPAADKETM